MSRFWNLSYESNLNYAQAYEAMMEGNYVSRPEWKGVHFIINGDYYILLKTGEIIKNPNEIYDKDKKDWKKVWLNMRGIKLLQDKKLYK